MSLKYAPASEQILAASEIKRLRERAEKEVPVPLDPKPQTLNPRPYNNKIQNSKKNNPKP